MDVDVLLAKVHLTGTSMEQEPTYWQKANILIPDKEKYIVVRSVNDKVTITCSIQISRCELSRTYWVLAEFNYFNCIYFFFSPLGQFTMQFLPYEVFFPPSLNQS